MILVAQQPNYFPWLGYLEQVARADRFVLLDDVQWLKRGWQRRARLGLHPGQAGEDGAFQWLSIPLKGAARDQRLCDLMVSPDPSWPLHHWKTIQSVYGRRPYFRQQVEPYFKRWFESLQTRLINGETILLNRLLRENLELCLTVLGMQSKISNIVFSSQLRELQVPNIDVDATKTQRLLRLCLALRAQTYYSGIASTSYIDLSSFRNAGIRVLWQRWRHPVYEQGVAPFVTHLSFLDVVSNLAIDEIQKSLEPLPWGPFNKLYSGQDQAQEAVPQDFRIGSQ